MRICRFRGKTEDGKWVKGSLLCYQEDGEDIVTIVSEQRNNIGLEYNSVDPETVGQFTGLHDKNNKGIYEGDIVECVSWNEFFSDPTTGEVMRPFKRTMYIEFRMGGFKMIEPMPSPMEDNMFDIIYNDDIQVIGNIYDNHELLWKQKS